MGAGKLKRVNRILPLCLLLVTGVGLALGIGSYLLGSQLLGIYSSEADVIAFGLRRMSVVCILSALAA